MGVVGDVEGAVGADCEAGRAMRGRSWLFNGACEAVGENLVALRRLAVLERLEDHVVALLRKRGAVPRAVERDKRAAAVVCGKLLSEIEHQRVRCPMRWIERDRPLLVRARSDRLAAVTSVLRSEHELALRVVEVTFRPPVVRGLDTEQLLPRQVRALFGGVEVLPVLGKLVASVLRRIDATPGRVQRDPISVADARRVALRG